MGLLDSLPLVNPDDRKRNMLADLLRGATGLLDEARPKVQDSWRNGLLSILNPEANQQRASDYLNRQNVTVGGKLYDYDQAMSDMAITGIAPLGMLAYHGSPHTFDKFSLDKIGTGEGAQAYGHGLYKGVTTDVSALARALRGETGAIAPTDRLAGLLGDNAGMTENAKFRISDVFGNGSRLDHYDDAKGLMYSQQKLPNGNSKWTVFETYPDSEGGNQVLGQMLQHGSLDDAIKSVRGARISQTLKTNNAAKYGGIPNTWDGEAKKVAKKLIDSGVDIDRFGQSTQSTSKYIYLSNGRKIRMANHDLPSNYDAADFDHRYGGDIQSLIDGIKQSP